MIASNIEIYLQLRTRLFPILLGRSNPYFSENTSDLRSNASLISDKGILNDPCCEHQWELYCNYVVVAYNNSSKSLPFLFQPILYLWKINRCLSCKTYSWNNNIKYEIKYDINLTPYFLMVDLLLKLYRIYSLLITWTLHDIY